MRGPSLLLILIFVGNLAAPALGDELALSLFKKGSYAKAVPRLWPALLGSANEEFADAILRLALEKPEAAAALFDAIAGYARDGADPLKDRVRALQALGAKFHILDAVGQYVAMRSGWNPWGEERPILLNLEGVRWRTLLGSLPPSAYLETVKTHRILKLDSAIPHRKEMRGDEGIFVIPWFDLEGGTIERFEVSFIGLESETSFLGAPEQVLASFRLAAQAEIGARIPEPDLSTDLGSSPTEDIRLPHETRSLLRTFPRLPSLFVLGVFAPDHPQAEPLFINVLRGGKGAAGLSLRKLGLEGLVKKKLESPAMIQALIEALSDEDSKLRKIAAYRLGLCRQPTQDVQLALLKATHDSNEQVSRAAWYALTDIAINLQAVDPAVLAEAARVVNADGIDSTQALPVLTSLEPTPPELESLLKPKALESLHWVRSHVRRRCKAALSPPEAK